MFSIILVSVLRGPISSTQQNKILMSSTGEFGKRKRNFFLLATEKQQKRKQTNKTTTKSIVEIGAIKVIQITLYFVRFIFILTSYDNYITNVISKCVPIN